MRAFCPEHHRSFFAPRQSPIRCGNQGHALGELDFQGRAQTPPELGWHFCCNCEHFYPATADHGIKRCAVCSRQVSAIYLCDRCYTLSFESDTPLQTKNFTITAQGVPKPSCAGCLHSSSTDLREHFCESLGVSLTTALSSCPVCAERLDVPTSFPASVTYYLKRTKAVDKLIVTFDYESELFVEVEDGEFVLVSNREEIDAQIVLPRSTQFSSNREFYEFYQDFYYCEEPKEGEVQIIEPARVALVPKGWKFQAPGIMEILGADKLSKGLVESPRLEPDSSAGAWVEHPPEEAATAIPCADCGALVETKYTFCWKCGTQLNVMRETILPKERIIDDYLAADLPLEEEEVTVQHDFMGERSSIFAWATQKTREQSSLSRKNVQKLIVGVVGGSIFLALGLFALMRVTSMDQASASSDTQLTETARQQEGTGVIEADRPADSSTPNPLMKKVAVDRSNEQELLRLRNRRISASPSDQPSLIAAFTSAEKQYPNDYRFPYERAKVITQAARRSYENEAFAALFLAAETAINDGKASAMLRSLESDKREDFRKLSQKRHEWTQLVQALKRKDEDLLR